MSKKIINNIILAVLLMLIVLSVYLAFMGSERASALAGSLPVAIAGIVLLVFILLSFFKYSALFAKPGLLMVHAGCMAVLAGAIWGGYSSHALRMKDMADSPGGGPVRYGKMYKCMVQLQKQDYFDALYDRDENGVQYVDALNSKIFLRDLEIQYYETGQIKDYISHVMIIADDGRHFGPFEIEVNKPLYWRGYHFYQSGFDMEKGSYSIIKVVSADGIWLVYAGYFLLISGVFWQFWIESAMNWLSSRAKPKEEVAYA